jgi:formylglycine-generating enzyme required for sulfatase activity
MMRLLHDCRATSEAGCHALARAKTAPLAETRYRGRGHVLASLYVTLFCGLLLTGCKKEDATGPSQSAPSAAVKTITTPTGIEMIQIPAGSFTMGSDTGDDDEKPPHKVNITSFFMDRYEVTQKAFTSLMGNNPSKFKDPQKPVDGTSWVLAVKYCNMRSQKEGLRPCYNVQTGECDFSANGYRLPTEAEWEYACRAGSTTAYSFGDNPAESNSRAWHKANANSTSHAVGQKQPNAWGLYDMHGNAAEWCNDRYSEKTYIQSASDNPRGPATGDKRVQRGGSWKWPADQSRSSSRASETPGLADACFGSEAYGFRCVKNAQ